MGKTWIKKTRQKKQEGIQNECASLYLSWKETRNGLILVEDWVELETVDMGNGEEILLKPITVTKIQMNLKTRIKKENLFVKWKLCMEDYER